MVPESARGPLLHNSNSKMLTFIIVRPEYRQPALENLNENEKNEFKNISVERNSGGRETVKYLCSVPVTIFRISGSIMHINGIFVNPPSHSLISESYFQPFDTQCLCDQISLNDKVYIGKGNDAE